MKNEIAVKGMPSSQMGFKCMIFFYNLIDTTQERDLNLGCLR